MVLTGNNVAATRVFSAAGGRTLITAQQERTTRLSPFSSALQYIEQFVFFVK